VLGAGTINPDLAILLHNRCRQYGIAYRAEALCFFQLHGTHVMNSLWSDSLARLY
jgi:hypothetical protein